ncbi:MAG: MFS transporter [Aeromicrobium sp.]|jgi:UMF1 family MFS transporter|nr:MAG: MFS transporter [Aeromicrobium sp.]
MTTHATGIPGEAQNRKAVWAWGMWDWGSAAFNAVIITFVFNKYLVEVVGRDLPGPVSASSWLGWALGASGLCIAIVAPLTGRQTDNHGNRKRSLFILTFAIVVITAAMFFVKDQYQYLWLGLLLVAVGSVLFELSQVPYFAMLSQVAGPKQVGKVSGFGWALGYVGGIALLLLCLFGFIQGDGDTRGLLNLPTEDSINIRAITLLAAAWFGVFALPLFIFVPEIPPVQGEAGKKTSIPDAYRELWAELKTMWAQDRETLKFLIASAFYRDGLSGVFTFGAIIAGTVFGLSPADVIYFGVAANIAAALGAFAGGWLDDRIGSRRVVMGSLVALLLVAIPIFFGSGKLVFWIFGLMLCLFVGPAQSASRSYLSRVTHSGHEGQNFGLYAMTGRAVSFMAPTLFGMFVFIGGGDNWGILGIMVVLAIGLVLLLRIDPSAEDHLQRNGSLEPLS